MFGAGLGYQINDWFRVDWTVNHYAEMDFTGSSAQNIACNVVVPGGGGTCSYSDNGTFSATTLLANAYVDLGNYHGFTPYLGAGIGGAYVRWGTLTNTEYEDAAPGNNAVDRHSSRSGWRFAYALHAGASYDINAHWKVDAGYSFTNISSGEMFGMGAATGNVGPGGFHDDIQIHAFKVGLRYQIW
jgi:opacity protein-like surface antigen